VVNPGMCASRLAQPTRTTQIAEEPKEDSGSASDWGSDSLSVQAG